MTSLRVYVQPYAGQSFYAELPIDIIDSKLETVARIAMGVGDSREVEVPGGDYLVSGLLPSGEVLRTVARVDKDTVSEVTIYLPPSPHEWLGWPCFMGNAARRQDSQPLSDFSDLWLRFWTNLSGAWRPRDDLAQQQPAYQDERSVLYSLFQQPDQLHFLQVGGAKLPWRLVSIPPTPGAVEVLVTSTRPAAGAQPDISVSVTTGHRPAEVLLRFIGNGTVDAARVVASHFLDQELKFSLGDQAAIEELKFSLGDQAAIEAESWAKAKRVDPPRAAIGFYYLLKTGALDRMHDWPNNFANWIPWLPDAAVIHAWQLLRIGGENGVRGARERLIQATTRGVPVYTEGLRLLHEGLQIFAGDPESGSRESISKALDWIRPYAEAADPLEPTTTFYGYSPDQPSLSLRYGMPADPGHGVLLPRRVPALAY